MLISISRSCRFSPSCGLIAFAMLIATMTNADAAEPIADAPVATQPVLNKSSQSTAKKKVAPNVEAPLVPPREGRSETIQLFNGKDLDGWIGHKKYWSVKEGVIVGKSTEAVPVSTYLLTKRDFSDFRLLVTCKLVEQEIHSGIAFWGRIAPEHGDEFTYAGHLVMFPSKWGLYDLFGREGLTSDKRRRSRKAGHQHDWNELEILAQGNRIRLVVNGKPTMDWRDPEPERIKEAPIGLQLHDESPQEVHFKNLILTTFPEDNLTTVK